jgi:hypothetical protein
LCAWSRGRAQDKCLARRVADEGIDRVSVGDIGELIVLLGEALNILLEGLISPLPTVAKVLRVPLLSIVPWK